MIKNNLSRKQVNLILTIIFIASFILFNIFLFQISNLNPKEEFLLIPYFSLILASITIFILYMLLDNGSKEMNEKYEKLNLELLDVFKETNIFYEVELSKKGIPEPKESMFLEIVKNEGYKFYAELLEDKCIHVICKDSNGKIIYDKNIKNYFYFDANFKFIPQNSR